MPVMDIEKAYQDRYTLAPRSRRHRPAQWYTLQPLFIYRCVRRIFLRLSTKLGIVSRGGHRVVRIHDLRHTFICRRLMLSQKDGTDVGNAMMALSTYVGHVRLSNTYWYIEAVPELMMIASDRFDAFAAGRPEVCHG